jgi:hypothetical protein
MSPEIGDKFASIIKSIWIDLSLFSRVKIVWLIDGVAQLPSARKNKFYSPSLGAGTKPVKPAELAVAPMNSSSSKGLLVHA